MKTLITKEYKKLNTELHRKQPGYGTSGKKHAAAVLSFAFAWNAKTILDYGCGKQTLRAAMAWDPDIKVIGYDPAIPGLDAPPLPADIVVCTDVMEHVEPGCVQAVLSHIFQLANKGVFFVICCIPGDRKLSNGELAHCSVYSPELWIAAISLHTTPLRPVVQLWNKDGEIGVWVPK